MNISFQDKELESLILYGKSSNSKYKKLQKSKTFLRDLSKVYNTLKTCPDISSLSNFGSLRYEKLKYDLSGKSSVRIGFKSKYRLIFVEDADGVNIELIEINEHYGDK